MSIVKAQRGVSIVESLVALVVLSVGMLGIAALYLESVKANRSALMRTQAVSLVTDMGDRIRTNRFGRNAYDLAVGVLPAQQGCVVANDCNELELATDDLAWWVAAVRQALPADSGGNPPATSIVYAPAPVGQPEQYLIRVEWREPNQDPADAPFRQQSIIRIVPVAPL